MIRWNAAACERYRRRFAGGERACLVPATNCAYLLHRATLLILNSLAIETRLVRWIVVRADGTALPKPLRRFYTLLLLSTGAPSLRFSTCDILGVRVWQGMTSGVLADLAWKGERLY